MSYPIQRDIEIPLLVELDRAGGQADPKNLYLQVAQHFPQLTEDELERRLESYPSTYKWRNIVQWVRQKLVTKGEMDGSVRGVWKITELGRKRILKRGPEATPIVEEITLQDLMVTHENAVRNRLSDRLYNLPPTGFELFAKQLLQALGFIEVEVTRRTRDGGIDGYGKLKQGIVRINAAFQCKRWRQTVQRQEIDRFRGAISGKFDQGIFLTTSKFSRDALAASIRLGTVPIIMIDGEKIIDLMVQQGIGVSRRPIYLLDVDETFFASAQ